MGNLIHAGENYRRVVEIVRSGALGTIFKTNVWMTDHKQRLGNPADSAPPSGLDYDFWLGPAPKRLMASIATGSTTPVALFLGLRRGGILCDFVCHIVDLVHWAMDVNAPATISATGGRFVTGDNAETPDTLEVIYHYPKPGGPGFTMVWTQTDRSAYGPEGKHLGIMFQGDQGHADRRLQQLQDLSGEGPAHRGAAQDTPALPRPPSRVARRDQVARADLVPFRVRPSPLDRRPPGQHRALDRRVSSRGTPRSGTTVTNHAQANQHLWRTEYRAPWSIPKV